MNTSCTVGAIDQDDFELASHIYIVRRPEYYPFANQTPTPDELQLIEKYASTTGESAA